MDIVEQLFRKNADSLHRLARLLVGPADAEDVLAEAMLKLIASVDLNGVDAPDGYLYRMVVNEAKMFNRSRSRSRRRDNRSYKLKDAEIGPEARPDVVDAVASLSLNQRAVVFCTYWEDMDRAATAERLGIAPGTVASHLFRAKRTLARRLKDV